MSFMSSTHEADGDQPSEALDRISNDMALEVFMSANDYLHGDRDSFNKVFVLASPVHARAAEKFAELLGEEGFGDTVELAVEDAHSVHDTGNDIRYQEVLRWEQVAKLGDRCIVAETRSQSKWGVESSAAQQVRYITRDEAEAAIARVTEA